MFILRFIDMLDDLRSLEYGGILTTLFRLRRSSVTKEAVRLSYPSVNCMCAVFTFSYATYLIFIYVDTRMLRLNV